MNAPRYRSINRSSDVFRNQSLFDNCFRFHFLKILNNGIHSSQIFQIHIDNSMLSGRENYFLKKIYLYIITKYYPIRY